MAELQPYAQVVDLATDAVLASTTNILDWSITFDLSKVGTLSIEVPAADAGDDLGGTGISFGAALLRASSDLGSTPRPLLLEFSLDGGSAFDSRKMVEQPQRTLKASERTIKEDGADLAATLSTVPQERVTFTDCTLVDVFNGKAGAIRPLASAGLVSGPIPHLHGLLTVRPGQNGWAGGYRLEWTGVIDPVVQGTATNVDVDSATTLACAETVVNRLAGAFIGDDAAIYHVPQGYRGHYVADPSDGSLNLGGQARSFVVGNVAQSATGGSTTAPHLTFDATGAYDTAEPFPEDRIARLHLDSAVVKSDDTTLLPACNFVGGRSTAGFPDGAKVTGLTVLNGTSTTAFADDHWLNGVPVIGVNVNDTSGGLYFTILDGTIRPVPGSPATACQSIGVDSGDDGAPRPFALLMGAPHGVYMAESSNVLSVGAGITWGLLGDLNADVVRLNVKIDPADTTHRVVFALVRGTGERTDGIHRWTNADGWQTVIQNTRIVDMVATDYQTLWVVFSQPQNTLFRYGISGGAGTEQAHYALPGAGQIAHVQEVITVSPAQDSIWVLTQGAPSPAYYLLNTAGAWGAWHDANQDSTLVGPDNTPLQLNRAVGLGVAFEGTTATVLVGTDQGVYGSKNSMGGALAWVSLNEQGGLANYNIKSIAAGEAQSILGTTVNRIFCTTEDDLLYSNSSGRWWQTIKGRDRTGAGAHLSTITVSIADANFPITGGGHSGQTLPFNRVRTWGTTNSDGTGMSTSPVSGDVGVHVTIPPGHPDELPQGYYWERYLDQHQDYQYRYVNQECPLAGLHLAQLPDLQSNAAVDADRASAGVMTVAQRFLPRHAAPQTVLSTESSFSDTAAALRSLRPTQLVRVDGTVTITDLSAAGTALTTRVWEAHNAPLWVLAHTMKKGPGMTAMTTTDLGTQLIATPLGEADLAAGLQDQVAALRVWR